MVKDGNFYLQGRHKPSMIYQLLNNLPNFTVVKTEIFIAKEHTSHQ
jgi:hypothetical protein